MSHRGATTQVRQGLCLLAQVTADGKLAWRKWPKPSKVISNGRIVTSGTPAEARSAGTLSGFIRYGHIWEGRIRCLHKQRTNNFNATTATHSASQKVTSHFFKKLLVLHRSPLNLDLSRTSTYCRAYDVEGYIAVAYFVWNGHAQHDPPMSYVAVVALLFPQVAESVRASVGRQPAKAVPHSFLESKAFVEIICTDPPVRESPWI